MMQVVTIYCVVIILAISIPGNAIDDPFNIFCGSRDCYEVLGIQRKEFDLKVMKKAYRKLSLTLHPDKNQEVDTTKEFRELAKAAEVLGNVEQKELYDYYLDHPREYYRVTGKFYYKQLPKSDVRVIVAVLVVLLSFLLPAVQYQKWKKAMDYVKYAASNNLGLKNGGTKETMEVYRRAAERYQHEVPGGEGVKQSKMMKDPHFLAIIEDIVGAVEVEGGYRKPTIKDVFVVKLVMLPFDIVQWGRRLYRYHYQSDQMSDSEKRSAAANAIGMGTWEQLTEADREFLVESTVWTNHAAVEELMAMKQEEELSKRPGMKKRYHRFMKNKASH